jgi:hypothetical protein
MKSNDRETRYGELVDRAIRARHEEHFADAMFLNKALVKGIPREEERLLAIVHNELGAIYLLGYDSPTQAEPHFREAITLRPRFEEASMALFHSLIVQDRWEEAYQEVLRFASLRDSPGYRELLSSFGTKGRSPAACALLEEAVARLNRWS